MSSTISTFCPGLTASACIWKKSAPYSFMYSAVSQGPGSLPLLRTGTNAAPRRSASVGPNRKPRASRPTMTSGFSVKVCVMCSSRAWMSASNRLGSAKMGRMSSNRMPGAGKSGNWRSAPLSFTLRSASSVEAEGPAVESLLWEALLSSVGSGLPAGGWAAVASPATGGSAGVVELTGWRWWAGESLGADMVRARAGIDMWAVGRIGRRKAGENIA